MGKKYYTLKESLGEEGRALIARDLKNERAAGQIDSDTYFHLLMEQRLTAERRSYNVRTQGPVHEGA